jgi:hypothetical protein
VQRVVTPLKSDAGEFTAGTFYIPNAQGRTLAQVQTLARELGVTFIGTTPPPAASAKPLRPVRIGLWDRYGGSIPSGWTRWLLERFEFPFEVVFPPRLNQENLREQFDVLVFVSGAIPSKSTNAAPGSTTSSDTASDKESDTAATNALANLKDENLPSQYRGRRGSISATNTIPKLREFLEAGGTILTIGTSTALAEQLGLPVANHLVENSKKEGEKPKPLPRDKFYIPGSLVRARVDNTQPLAWGLGQQVDFMFQASPVFRLGATTNENGGISSSPLHTVAWFDEKEPLHSGWAIGQNYLQNGLAIIETSVGKGHLVLFGPEISFRAQPHGTFRFLFNGIVNAGMAE